MSTICVTVCRRCVSTGVTTLVRTFNPRYPMMVAEVQESEMSVGAVLALQSIQASFETNYRKAKFLDRSHPPVLMNLKVLLRII